MGSYHGPFLYLQDCLLGLDRVSCSPSVFLFLLLVGLFFPSYLVIEQKELKIT